MASPKPLTEEQLQESIFGKILHSVMKGRFDRVAKALDDNPRMKKAAEKAEKSIKAAEREFKRQTKGRKIVMKKF
jgi:F0F1-type ATP synthase membrane subunit b/b'